MQRARLNEAGDKEEIVYGELLKWENLNLNNFEDDYSDEEEGTVMLNSGSSGEEKRDHFRLTIFYLYLDTYFTFN